MGKITDGMYAYIAGTVSDVKFAKTGLMVTVEVQREKAQYPDRVTVWAGDGMYGVGDRVKFKGWLSWQRREVEGGKTYFNVSINKPELVEIEKAQVVTAEQVAADILGATPIDDEMPF